MRGPEGNKITITSFPRDESLTLCLDQPVAFRDDMKGFLVISMNGNGTDLEQDINTHRTS